MNLSGKQLKALTIGFSFGMASLSPAWGDDLDIYFGAKTTTTEFQPNILMIIDTSGSMAWDYDANGKDIGKPRLDHVKTAAKNFIAKAQGLNIGLMRFNGQPGGPVLFPIKPIDLPIGQLDPVVSTRKTITTGNDDGIQYADNSVDLTSKALRFGSGICTDVKTKTISVTGTADDSEQRVSNGAIVTDSADLEDLDIPLRQRSGWESVANREQVVGIRFEKVSIPETATIVSATLSLTAIRAIPDEDTGTMDITVYGHKDAESPVFGSTANGISSRAKTLESKVFRHSDDLELNQIMDIPDLAPIVKEIMTETDWEIDKPLTFILQKTAGGGNGSRYFYSRNKDDKKQPKLTITYTLDNCATTSAKLGLRFDSISIPKGSTITKATLNFHPLNKTGNPQFTINGQINTATTFETSNANFTTGPDPDRTLTTASETWEPSDAEWTSNVASDVNVGLKNIVQEIVKSNDWCGGDAMALFINPINSSGNLSAIANDGTPASAPTLSIEYESALPTNTQTCRKTTLNRQVKTFADDAYQLTDSDNAIISGTNKNKTLKLESKWSGVRFSNLQIPGTADDIESAYLEFTAADTNNSANTFYIYGQTGTATPAEFISAKTDFASRSLTPSSISMPTATWTKNTVYRSPDIAPLVKAVLNSLGSNWVPGTSSLAFILKNPTSSSAARAAYSYDGTSSERIKAPRLIINFKDRSLNGLGVRTVRDELLDQIDGLIAYGNTPIQDTLYESVLYYSGRPVDYGAYRGKSDNGGPSGKNRVSHPRSMVEGTFKIEPPAGCTTADYSADICKNEKIVGANSKSPTYLSPLNDNQQCLMTNNVILLTDGEARSSASTTKIKTLIGKTDDCEINSGDKACIAELVKWAHTEDIVPNADNNVNFAYPINGMQTLKFYTIGFAIDDPLLETIAEEGGGLYSTVSDEVALETTFDTYFGKALEETSTFVAPVAAVNAFNRLFSLDDLYFAIFQPDRHSSWKGNLKKYKIGDDASILGVGDGVATANGKFVSTARSYWSSEEDGAEVTKGGANENVPSYSSRNIYTYTGNYSGTTAATDGSTFTLTASRNLLQTNNSNLTASLLGNPTEPSDYRELIEWIRGKDIKDEDATTTTRHVIGDPLHSSPVAITYGGTESDPDIMIYLTTNTGFLHAINAKTGVEQWAFLPKELLGVQEMFYQNEEKNAHLYGLDGAITTWIRDNNIDGTLDPTVGDHAYLYFGMRRGGRNYYAVDVTNSTTGSSNVSPKLKWVIRGGITSGFGELGESWAQPLRAKINVNGTIREALIISGGYDSNKDSQTIRQEDTIGRAIFIVDANNGNLIWSGGPKNGVGFSKNFDDLKYSIPASPAAVDINADGLIDQFYVGDLGGQVWRFDVNNGAATSSLISGGVIADLALDNSALNNRRFYQSPDVSIGNKRDGSKYLAVVLGSGWRENPLDETTQDRFYRIDQHDMQGPPASYSKTLASELYDASSNIIGTISTELADERSDALNQLEEAKGWYFDLPNRGEKTMSSPQVDDGVIYFNTFEPEPPTANTCVAQAGVTRAYAVTLGTASGIKNWDEVGDNDRSRNLPGLSLIDRPSLIYRPDDIIITQDPLQPQKTGRKPSDLINKTYWREEQ